MRLADLAARLDNRLRIDLSDDWDNPGLLVGDRRRRVSRALLALDVTPAVLREAGRRRADLLVVHHPLIFQPLKRVVTDDRAGRLVGEALRRGVAVYSAHTGADVMPGGINDALAAALGIRDGLPLAPRPGEPRAGHGRWGRLARPAAAGALIRRLKRRLHSASVRAIGDPERTVLRAGVCSGSGGEFLEDALELGLDLLVTGDLKHDRFVEVADTRLVLADLGHAETDWFGFERAVTRVWSEDAVLSSVPLVAAREPWVPIRRV